MWGAVNAATGGSNWVSDPSSIWGDTHNSNIGFWDEAVKEASLPPPPATKKGNPPKNNKGNANLRYPLQCLSLNFFSSFFCRPGLVSLPSLFKMHGFTCSSRTDILVVCIISPIICLCSNSVSGRANKKVEEEEKLLKLFQGVNKSQQDGFMQWCEQTLHMLNTANNLDGKLSQRNLTGSL